MRPEWLEEKGECHCNGICTLFGFFLRRRRRGREEEEAKTLPRHNN